MTILGLSDEPDGDSSELLPLEQEHLLVHEQTLGDQTGSQHFIPNILIIIL